MEDTRWSKPERNTRIYADRKTGMSYRELGKKYGLSNIRVRNICEERKWLEASDFSGMTARTANGLMRCGIMTKQELVDLINSGKTLRMKNIGIVSIGEIEKFTGIELDVDANNNSFKKRS